MKNKNKIHIADCSLLSRPILCCTVLQLNVLCYNVVLYGTVRYAVEHYRITGSDRIRHQKVPLGPKPFGPSGPCLLLI
jgi:hypothetical protein